MKRPVVLLLFLCCAAVAASAQDAPPWVLGGSLAVLPFAAYASDFTYGSSTTLGLVLRTGGGRARAEASLEAAVLSGASARLAWGIAGTPYGRADEILVPSSPTGDYAVTARVRTLYTKLDLDGISFTAGRQVVNYGRGALWSPTDIFTELDLTGISPVRRGTDALRVTAALGETAGFDLVAAPTLAPADGRYSARLTALLGDVLDAGVVAARDGAGRTNPPSTSAGWQLGADFKTDVEVGLTGEAVYFQPDAGGWGWVRAAGGLDWSVGDFILGAEYYYNGGGAAADPLFPGTHNASASVTWNVSQLFRAALDVIANIEEPTGTATVITTVSAAQNADVTAFLQAGYDVRVAAWSAQAGLGVEVKF